MLQLNIQILKWIIRLFKVNPANKSQFISISPERGFADFIFAHVILHLIVVNFIGWIYSTTDLVVFGLFTPFFTSKFLR